MKRPLVFVGPSGIGKGTIERILIEKYPGYFRLSVSHTTRQARQGEVDGVNYYFTDRITMEKEISEGKFLESCEIHGNLYGTSIKTIEEVQNSGYICILDVGIDFPFASIEETLNPFTILLLPTSIEAIEQRLRERGTDDEESIQKRMKTTREELIRYIEKKEIFNLSIVNDKLEVTLEIIETALKEIGDL